MKNAAGGKNEKIVLAKLDENQRHSFSIRICARMCADGVQGDNVSLVPVAAFFFLCSEG